MIDIHTHILPGLDDGAQSIEETLAMARMAALAGDRILFATPHLTTARELEKSREIAERVATAQAAIHTAEIPITLVAGAEVYPMPEIIDAIEQGMPLTMGTHGRYLLLDSPQADLPLGFDDLIFQLQLRRITPILAHPERISAVQRTPQMLEGLLHRGMLLQVTVGSLLGEFGELARRTGMALIKSQWVHFLASDAHKPAGPLRCPGVASAVQRLAGKLDAALLQTLTVTNGQCVVEGDPVLSDPQAFAAWQGQGWLRFFRKM